MVVMVIPYVVRALRKILKVMEMKLKEVEIGVRIETIYTTVFLRSKVLEI